MERHPIDLLSLLAGLLAIAIGVAALVPGTSVLDMFGPATWPLLLVLAGLALLASSFGGTRRPRPSEEPAAATDETPSGRGAARRAGNTGAADAEEPGREESAG